jgi:hypothetical protein
MARPTDYKPEYCEMLIEHMAKGYSFESFAGITKTCKDTIYHWAKIHPEFSEAKKQAFEQSRLFWETLAIENALNISESLRDKDGTTRTMSKALNSTIWIFNMKNRFKDEWREKQELDVSSDKGISIKIEKEDENL